MQTLSRFFKQIFVRPFYKPVLGLAGIIRFRRYLVTHHHSFVVISHDAALSGGASLVLREVIKELDIPRTVFLFQKPGPMMEMLTNEGYPCFMVYKYARYVARLLASAGVEKVFVNTLVLKRFVQCIESRSPRSHVVWWIHENNGIIDHYLLQDSWVPNRARVVAVSSRVEETLKHYGWKCADIIPWFAKIGLPSHFKREGKKLSDAPERLRVCFVGLINENKNPIEVLQACELLPLEIKRVLSLRFFGQQMGNKEYFKRFSALVEKCGYARYCGVSPRDQMPELYRGADLLICPSVDDPLPVVVAEAIQYGCGVVVSDATGYASTIENGKNGFVYPLHNIEALANCIKRFYEMPNKEHMLKSAFHLLQSQYAPEYVCQRFKRLIFES